ncbi:MAG: hypothetical protein AB4352_21180 [Hormoscilla sp.]
MPIIFALLILLWVGGPTSFILWLYREKEKDQKALPGSMPIGYLPPAPEASTGVSGSPDSSSHELHEFPAQEIMASNQGILIVGNQGAAKSSLARYLISNFLKDAAVIVFDPHNDPNADWGGAYRIVSMENIFAQMQILMTSIEERDTSPIIIICDDWIQIRCHDLNLSGKTKGLADKFIKLFSVACRKFNKAVIFIMHSPNVKEAGIDSYLRCNYSIIYLGKMIYNCQDIKKYMPQSLQKVAYPCVFESVQYRHPTHGHHVVFRPQGMVPRNIEPVRSAPITIELVPHEVKEVFTASKPDIKRQLERLYQLEPEAPASRTVEPRNQPSEPLEPLRRVGFSSSRDGSEPSEPSYTDLNLTRQQALELINKLKERHNQTQIIEMLWNCTKGEGKRYQDARVQYKEITGV